MNGSRDWPSDEDIGGPYAYETLVVQRNGVRFSCDSPVVPLEDVTDMYRALAAVQKELVAASPRTLEEAFEITAKVRLPSK